MQKNIFNEKSWTLKVKATAIDAPEAHTELFKLCFKSVFFIYGNTEHFKRCFMHELNK